MQRDDAEDPSYYTDDEPRCTEPLGPLSEAERRQLFHQTEELVAKEREFAVACFRRNQKVWLWLPGMQPGRAERLGSLREWNETYARYRGAWATPLPKARPHGLRIVHQRPHIDIPEDLRERSHGWFKAYPYLAPPSPRELETLHKRFDGHSKTKGARHTNKKGSSQRRNTGYNGQESE